MKNVYFEQLFERNVKVHVLNVGLLENTTMDRFFLQTLLAVAEMTGISVATLKRESRERKK